jgi:3-phenylpropionate/trans-cinnamate dioxygenase ferredoxin component
MQTKCHWLNASKRDWPAHDIALPRSYPAHSGGRSGDEQDARFPGGEGDMAWIEVAGRAEVPAGGMLEVEAGGRALLLYDLSGTVFATSAICPHHAAFLSQGHVSGESIECPRHMGRFHIPSGRQERGPACPDLRTYKVRVEDARVLVEI